MNDLFYSLIRLSLGTSNNFSHHPSSDEWSNLYRIAVKQSLVGVCFVGVRRYMEIAQQSGNKPSLPQKLYYQWLGTAVQIQQ